MLTITTTNTSSTNPYYIGGPKEEEVQNNSNQDLIIIEDGSYIIYEDNKDKKIITEYQTIGGTCQISMNLIDKDVYEYNITTPNTHTKFVHKKPLHHIGQSKSCNLFKTLQEKINQKIAIPDGPEWGGDPLQRITQLLESLNYNSSIIKPQLDNIIKVWLRELSEINTPSWFEAINEIDDFSSKTLEDARLFLLKNNFVEEAYTILSKRVAAQKPKVILAFLISLSSVLDKPIHSVVTGKPGNSKSTITEAIFECFPQHRRIEIEPLTTESGLMNMTKFKEGNRIFYRKLIKLGDWGDAKEQENTKFLMSFFKVIMSEGKYTKILTDMNDDNNRATILKLVGCGSVNLQVVTPDVEGQFQSRTLVWSPDDNKGVRDAIRDFQTDDVNKYIREAEFRKGRELLAASIEQIFEYVESLTEHGAKFDIINPFNDHINALLQVDDSPNSNRDRPMIMSIPKLVTLSNCFNRQLYYNPEYDVYNLVVTAEDYLYTVKTLGKALSYFIHKKSEALQSYMDIVENKMGLMFDLEGNIKNGLYGYDELVVELDKPLKDRDPEFLEMYPDMTGFTYKDFSKFITANPKTVSRYVTELVDLGVLCRDTFVKPHRVFVPSDYGDRKRMAFDDIFDPERPVPENTHGGLDIGAMSYLKDVSKIQGLYDGEVRRILAHGWQEAECPIVTE